MLRGDRGHHDSLWHTYRAERTGNRGCRIIRQGSDNPTWLTRTNGTGTDGQHPYQRATVDGTYTRSG